MRKFALDCSAILKEEDEEEEKRFEYEGSEYECYCPVGFDAVYIGRYIPAF